MKELIEQLRKYESRIDREIADALEQQAKQIEELAAALAGKDELVERLMVEWTPKHAHACIKATLDALQPHAALVAKIKANAVREWASYEENGGSMNAYEYADRIERGEVK